MAESSQIILAQGDDLPPIPLANTVSLTVNPVTGNLHIIDGSGTSEDLLTGAHDHDDRYYTETETDNLLDGKKNDFTENSAFNKNFGHTNNTVARGVHDHYGLTNYSNLDGIDTLFIEEGQRGKALSVETIQFLYAENSVSNNEWMKIGRAIDTDTGHIMPHDGCIIGVTAFCENGNNRSQTFRYYLNGAEIDNTFIQFPAGYGNVQYIDTTKDFDFVRGDRIRLRAGTSGSIYDTNISLLVKWRIS